VRWLRRRLARCQHSACTTRWQQRIDAVNAIQCDATLSDPYTEEIVYQDKWLDEVLIVDPSVDLNGTASLKIGTSAAALKVAAVTVLVVLVALLL